MYIWRKTQNKTLDFILITTKTILEKTKLMKDDSY